MPQGQELDRLINWTDFYRQYIPKMKSGGVNKMVACCPFHREENASFWFRTTNGLWKCEAGCGSGNATSFLAKIENIETSEAHKRLCELAGLPLDEPAEPGKKRVLRYSLDEYALEKRLPKEWLQSLGIATGKDGDCIFTPYKNESGKKVATRIRRHPSADPRFAWSRGSHPMLYGVWRMEDIKKAKYVSLVEGESDTQTMWHLGISALGIPGSSTFNVKMASVLLDIPVIYLHVEPDKAGRKLRAKICEALLEVGYTGTVKSWATVRHEGCKDPSALYIQEGAGAAAIMLKLMKEGATLDLEQCSRPDNEALAEAPIMLRMPTGYEMDERGIYAVKNDAPEDEPFCWTPIVITRTLPHRATNEIKMELAYYRRGKWHTAQYPRLMLASGRTIVALSEVGMDINSENSGAMVRFLSALERANTDRIPIVQRITRYGWIDQTHFAPGACEGFHLDSDAAGRGGHCVTAGSFDAWKEVMQKHRERAIFRFVMASAFGAPLLRILSQRIFLVYNWGDSMGGKTACMFAALSVWGDPERLKVNFNSTSVGLERAASFYCDLPLGINERQVADSKQSFLDAMVYMLSEGEGKLRGNKGGGLQEQLMWRTIVLSSGEEPLLSGVSKSGANNRTLEIFGPPFNDKAEASRMYKFLESNYGHAGPEFIKHLIDADAGELRKKYNEFRTELSKYGRGKSESHISSVGVVVLADFLASQWVFGNDEKTARDGAIGMGIEILGCLQSQEELDVNERAYRFLLDWIVSNADQFTEKYRMKRFGLFERDDPGLSNEKKPPHHALIVPSLLEEEFKKAGYSHSKTIRWLAEKGAIDVAERGGRVRYVVSRRLDGISTDLIRLALPKDALEGFTVVDDTELPF